MKKLFELIKLYWGYIATVAAIAGSAWGLKSDIEKKAIKEYSGQVKERSYEGKIDKLIKADSLKTITLQELITNQSEMISKQEEQKNAYNSLRTVVLDIAKNQKVTLDQMQQYMESTPVLKKKLTTEL